MARSTHGLALGIAALTGTAHAHHSISAAYDSSRQLTVEGRVTEFRFVDPHPLLLIAAAGAEESWQLELDNRSELAQIGITAETFQPGDAVVATGSAGRSRTQSLYVRRLDRAADGLRYEQVGSRPQLVTLP
jgi:hypothetical protein